MPIRAVLFDYGHTLVDFTVPEDALHDVYGTIRERLAEEAAAELPGAPEMVDLVARRVIRAVEDSYAKDRLIELDILALFEDALKALGLESKPETVRWVAETEHDALTRHLICPPETIEALEALHENGLKIGVVSNAHLLPYMMRRDWTNLGFGHVVDASVISCELGIRKPSPAIFQACLDQLGVGAEESVFVGDRLFDDVGGAHAVSMRGILTREFRQEDVPAEGEQPDLVVDRLAEIVPWIVDRMSD